jgi:hypothetical protein
VTTFVPAGARKVEQHFAPEEAGYDYDFSPAAGMLRLTARSGQDGVQWWDGDFVDYRGIVTISVEDRYTRLDTVAGGRCHVRTWTRGFGDRTVARLCRAFLTDLHGAPDQPVLMGREL